ncbi:hypothetical protein INT46_002981 [Mucor plumbeus]|uniref:Uncharacterized protein n=1 Tax=Mucor plumbeus TaxID=97098 RepID=A0A8H7R9I8_9FUNG|nr:hypothetical protein INT46_002981 [Mucor plumbeus]
MFEQLLKHCSPFTNFYNSVSTAFQHSDNKPNYFASDIIGSFITMNESEEEEHFMVIDKMLLPKKLAIPTEESTVNATIFSPLVGSKSHNDISELDDNEKYFMFADKTQTENLTKASISSAPDNILNSCNFNDNCSIIDEIEEDFFMTTEQESLSAKSALVVNHSVGTIDNDITATTCSDSNEFVMVEQLDYNPFSGNTDSSRILEEIERYFMTIDNPMDHVDPHSRLSKPLSTEIAIFRVFVDKLVTTPAICLLNRVGNFAATPVVLLNYFCTMATTNSCLANFFTLSTAAPVVDNAYVLVNMASNAATRFTLVKHIRKFAASPRYLVGRLCNITTVNSVCCVSKKPATVSHSNLVLKSFRAFASAYNSMTNVLYKIATVPTHLANCVSATIPDVKVNATRKSTIIFTSVSMAKSLRKLAAVSTLMANGFHSITATPMCLFKHLSFSVHASTHVCASVNACVNTARQAPNKSTTITGSGSITKSLRKLSAAHTKMVNCLYTIAITPGHLLHCIGVNIANVNGNAYRRYPAVSTVGPITKTLYTFATVHNFMVNGLYKIVATPTPLLNCVGAKIGIFEKNATGR